MKGLLLKDMYTLLKQARAFLLMIAIFALIPGSSVSGFATVYSIMLPVTALAYDERAQWNELAAMMPYSTRDIVLSKYFLGYIAAFGAVLLSSGTQAVVGAVRHTAFGMEELAAALVMLCVALLIQAVNLPFMFRLGVEKGRMVYLVLVALGVLGAVLFGNRLAALLEAETVAPGSMALAALALTVAVNAVSIFLSIRLYRKQQA